MCLYAKLLYTVLCYNIFRMRKLHTHEWIGVIIAVTVVAFLIVEGVFGDLFKPGADHALVNLDSEGDILMNDNNTQDLPGLKIETIKEGSGEGVRAFNEVTVHYTGTLTDGTVFDSSIPRGNPFTFIIGQGSVIQGWEEGILGMKVGEKRRLTIAPEKAYGQAQGHELQNETLVFEVELLGIQ